MDRIQTLEGVLDTCICLIALTGTITTTKTDADDTLVTITDGGGGASALQTFTGQIGTATHKIASLTVGAAMFSPLLGPCAIVFLRGVFL